MPNHTVPRRLVVEFTKMSGAGNDFIVIDNRFYNFSLKELSTIAKRMCFRQFGIGADGLLALAEDASGATDYRMIYINADGSTGTMCGNGARCLGRFAKATGINGTDSGEMRFISDAGVYRIIVPDEDVDEDEDVRLFLTGYKDYKTDINLRTVLPQTVVAADYIWTGTEHVVCWAGESDDIDVERLGPLIRHDEALAPNGANVSFAHADRDGEADIQSRTFEKGVEAETLACGTGAVAIAISALRRGYVDGRHISIQMKGGTLKVGIEGSVEHPDALYLDGPAVSSFRGTFEL